MLDVTIKNVDVIMVDSPCFYDGSVNDKEKAALIKDSFGIP